MKRALQKLIILSFFLLINSNYCWAIEQDSYTPTAIISIQKGKTESVVPFSINLDGQNSKDPQNFPLKFKWEFPNNKTSTSKNPKSYKFKKPGNYKIRLTVSNPLNLSHSTEINIKALKKHQTNNSGNIIISEVFPNPKGKDKGHEWIELYNKSEKSINLENWKFKTTNSNIKINKKTINPKDYLIINNFNKTLKNKEEKIQLLDPSNTIIDEINYQNAKEDLSFTNKKHWVKSTKNTKNNKIIKIENKIKEINNNKMTIGKHIIEIPKKNELLNNILKKNKTVIITAEKQKTKTLIKNIKTKNYKQKKKKRNNWTLKIILVCEAITPLLIYTYNKSFKVIAL